MNSPEENAETAVDLFEKHLGQLMPDEVYDVEMYPPIGQLESYVEESHLEVMYRMECEVESDLNIISEWELKGTHHIYGELNRIEAEYDALVNELDDRFDVSDFSYSESRL